MEFSELLDRLRALGAWRLVEELTATIDRLVETERLIKFMDSVLRALDRLVPEYKLDVLGRLEAYVYTEATPRIAEALVTRAAPERVVPYITMWMFYEVLRAYEEYAIARDEESRQLLKWKIERYAEWLKRCAKEYPSLTARGLLLFVDAIDYVVKVIGDEIARFGRPL